MKLKGKKALITGASRGIGRGIAEIFADEGADVAVNDIPAQSSQADEVVLAVRNKGRKSAAVMGDVARRADVEAMIDKAWKELGGLDILVNNAGIETIVPFLELTDEQWTRLVDVNLRGPWLCSQVFCRKAIAEKRKGSIVHIGSIQAAKVLPGRTHYAPTKLALEALTRNMSAEVTPLGIRVNCVVPGLVLTPERFAKWEREMAKRSLDPEDAERGRRRLAFDELLVLQVGLARRDHARTHGPGHLLRDLPLTGGKIGLIDVHSLQVDRGALARERSFGVAAVNLNVSHASLDARGRDFNLVARCQLARQVSERAVHERMLDPRILQLSGQLTF